MSEIKGCMNCGNIACGNNKKRDCAGCGRWISPEDKIAFLEGFIKDYKEQVKNDNDSYSEKLNKSKKLLKQWYQTSLNNGCDTVALVAETENFLEELSAE